MKRDGDDLRGDEFDRAMSRFLDGELEVEEQRSFEALLERSEDGRRLVEEQRRIDRLAAAALQAALGSRGGSAREAVTRDAADDVVAAREAVRRGAAVQEAAADPAPAPRVRRRALLLARLAAALLVAASAGIAFWCWATRPRQPAGPDAPALSIGDGSPAGPREASGDSAELRELVRPASWTDREKARSLRAPPAAPLAEAAAHLPSSGLLPFGGGESRGERWTQSRLLGMFDEEEERLYLFEVDRIRTRWRLASLDL